MGKLKVPKQFCRKKPGDEVRLFFRTGQEHLGTQIYEMFYRIVEFYPFIILCVDESGFNRCFGYWEFRCRLSKIDTMKMK